MEKIYRGNKFSSIKNKEIDASKDDLVYRGSNSIIEQESKNINVIGSFDLEINYIFSNKSIHFNLNLMLIPAIPNKISVSRRQYKVLSDP